MQQQTRKDLLTIFILSVVFGGATFFMSRLVDSSVANVINLRSDIDSLTRTPAGQTAMTEEVQAVEEAEQQLQGNLPETNEVIDILEQLEVISDITNTELTINLEEGILGESEIIFEDEKEKAAFLNKLKVKEYEVPQTTEGATQEGNVALQMMEEEEVQTTEGIKINYIEMNLVMSGTYDDIRSFIKLLQDSKYFFNIKEIKLIGIDGNQIESAITVRAFIFETE